MSHECPVSRRDFFRAGVAAAAGAAALPALATGQEQAKDQPGGKESGPIVLPRRRLGRTGVDVTILNQGAAFDINQRHMNLMHQMGIRYIDTAKMYQQGGSERSIAGWFKKTGHRKDYFLVTKDIPHTPDQLIAMVKERLTALETDYIDMFFLHAMGDSSHYNGVADTKWFNDKEWIKATDKLRRSGKCKFFGFSSHTELIDTRIGLLNGAAKGGWVDAVMVGADPVVIRENAEFNKALDACHKAGVGLISMKECRSKGEGIAKIIPGFKAKGLSPFTAVLTAMWSDERFATVCSHMDNIEKLRENATAARNFKPLTDDEHAAVRDMIRQGRRTFCVACDGSCKQAGKTQAELNKIARYVAYAEQDGRVYEARDLLQALPGPARDWAGADLAAASRACKCNLDFASITQRAEELLA